MKVTRIEDYQNGWFVGDFKPSAYRTEKCEVSYMRHHKGQQWPNHYHRIATEINVLLKGRMYLVANDAEGFFLNAGDVFVVEPGEPIHPTFLEDCELIVVKTPSIPGDKYTLGMDRR